MRTVISLNTCKCNLSVPGLTFANESRHRALDIRRSAKFDALRIRRLMVPLDGSAFAERALPLAVDIARRADAELVVVHVDSTSDQPMSRDRLVERRHNSNGSNQHNRDYVGRMAEELRHESSIRVAPIGLKNRDVATALCDVANDGADLVVMGAYGKGPIRRWVSGSTAKELTRRLTAPLIVVGSEGSFATQVPEHVHRILIALDGSRGAEQALGPALALSELAAGESILLRVVPLSSVLGPLAQRSGSGELHRMPGRLELAAARRYLHRVARRMERKSCTVDTRVVFNQKSIARTIAFNAQACDADLIAIATRKDANKRWLGSIAERVVHFASVPVLVAAA